MEKTHELVKHSTGITCDSRQVKPGNIFVAIRGRSEDGNIYAASAAQKGAIAIISDYPAAIAPLNIPVISVADARRSLAELVAEHYGHPSENLSLTGVTGTNGKTTITYMLRDIFRQAGLKAGLIGTVVVDTGKLSIPSTLTTPDAASLQSYLAEMRENSVTHAAMEVSAQGIELQRTHAVNFSCGVITNIGPDHLDFHGSFQAYYSAKKQFISLLRPDKPLIINGDDPYCAEIAAAHAGEVITVGFKPHNAVRIETTRLSSFGSSFILSRNQPLHIFDGKKAMKLALPGKHNIENAAMATVAAILHGVTLPNIKNALAAFTPVCRRMEVSRIGNLTIIDDTALNPGSIQAVFDSIGIFRYRRLLVVNAIRGSRGEAINVANAETLGILQHSLSFSLFVTCSNDFTGKADQVSENEKSAFIQALNNTNAQYCFSDTLRTALENALAQSVPGDLIVLLGAQGMDDGLRVLREIIDKQGASAIGINLEPIAALV